MGDEHPRLHTAIACAPTLFFIFIKDDLEYIIIVIYFVFIPRACHGSHNVLLIHFETFRDFFGLATSHL